MRVILAEQCNFADAVREILNGATIVYPTETCYGLGGDATDAETVKKIYGIKGRKDGKPLIVIVDTLAQMAPYVAITPTLAAIDKKYWPGPLTVVVPAKPNGGLPPGVVAPDGTVAFRVSGHHLARDLARALARPLISTSANLAGEHNLYSVEAVEKIFRTRAVQPDIIIDFGSLPAALPSTVVRLDGERVTVVRVGSVVYENN